jgi:SNF2 family DNA or RNA helicase
MRITYRDGIYIAISKYEERPILAEAGFFYHKGVTECQAGPQTCPACKTRLGKGWWSKRSEAAVRLHKFCDERAVKKLSAHLQAVQASRATDAEIEIPHPPEMDYRPYQRAGIAFMANRASTLLADEPGLGKTAQTLGVININPDVKNVLIICPVSLRTNWQREAEMWLIKDSRNWRFAIASEDVPVSPHLNFVITNYERVTINYRACTDCGGQRRKEILCPGCDGTGNGDHHPLVCQICSGKKWIYCPTCRGRGKVPGSNIKIYESLMARDWDLLAVDECHKIKNEDALRTKAILGNRKKGTPGLIHKARRRIFLTGTPMPNRPVEMWPVIHACSPDEFPNYKGFVKRYCGAHEEFVGKNKKVWKVDGASNLEELQERLRSTIMIRRLKKDVLPELPAKIRQVVFLTPSNTAKKLIAQEMDVWEKKFGAQLNVAQEEMALAEEEKDSAGYASVVEKLKYIQKVAFFEMAEMRKAVAVAKIPSVIEHLTDLFEDGTNKIVCFAHHHAVIHAIKDHFGSKAVSIYGETKAVDRQLAVDGFQKDPKIKLFIGGIQAAGTGLTLTASSYVVFAELDWTPSNVTQAEDRCHRIGQADTVNVQHLVIDGSLDARMAQMLVEKQEIADRALDNSTEVKAVKSLFEARNDVPVPHVPTWKKDLLKVAMQTLAQRRDKEVEGSHGFSSYDATIGQKLATWPKDYSDRQANLAITFSKKYRMQLPVELQKQIEVWEPLSPAEERKARMKAGKIANAEAQTNIFDVLSKIAT